MAVTTTQDAMTTIDADVQISVDGTTWTDLGGESTSVEVPEQTRMTGTAYVFAADVAIIGQGKREPVEITANALYTETAGQTFEVIRPLFQAGTKIYFRYSPKGIGASGRAVYTASNDGSTAGPVTISAFDYPDIDASSADPTPCMFKVMVPCLIRTTTGNSTGLGST